jgi:hypothetical protein
MMVRLLVSQLLLPCIEKLPSTDALSTARKHEQTPPPTESFLGVMRELIDRFPTTFIVLNALHVVQFLVGNGADVDASGGRPAHNAWQVASRK